MSSNLVLHCGAKQVNRAELACVQPPEPTKTWVPLSHISVLSTVTDRLESAGFSIKKEALGLSREGHRFFGTLDLRNELSPGVSLSVGVRNSTDKSFPIGFCAGSRTFVCDNLAFSSELVVNRKHTVNGEIRFEEALSLGVGRLTQFQAAETRRIEVFRDTDLAPYQAEALMLRAYEADILSTRTLGKALEAYRTPGFDWGPTSKLWHLFNAMNFPMQDRSRTNPQAFALTTMKLMSLLGAAVGFDMPQQTISREEIDADGVDPDVIDATFAVEVD